MTDRKEKKADIVAVARAAKVSISTVSRSFNHPDLVKPDTRKKIDAAVRRLGYIRNRAAQTIHGIRSATIGFIVPTIDHAIFAEVVQAFSDAVGEHGFSLLLASHGYDLEREYAVLRKLLEHRVDGVALIGFDHSEETYQLIESQKIPAITIWNYDPASRLPCVGAENREAGRLAAQHVVGRGHRDIAVIFPPTKDNDRARHRKEAVFEVLAAAGVEPRPDWLLEAEYSISDAKTVLRSILSRTPRPSAVLAGNDVLAVGAVYSALELGLRIPEDLSVTGIGDFKGSKEMEPALTTVRLPARTIGKLAGEEIAGAILEPDAAVKRTKCEVTLLVRDT